MRWAGREGPLMQVTGGYLPGLSGPYLRGTSLGRASSVGARQGPTLRDFAKLVMELRDTHKVLRLDGRYLRSGSGSKGARVESATSLGLQAYDTATTLRSTEEVNTVPTSFSTTAPDFAGSSSSSPTIGGTYDGSNGDTTLTVTATGGGIIGLLGPRFEVRDGDGNLLDTIAHGFNGAGTVFTLSNGLELSFSSGTIQLGDSFQLDVSASVGGSVRLDNAFDGTGDASAGFDEGFSVGAGSFEVNGVAIAVNANDTLRAVLERITASAAGVTASFDAATESVLLTQQTLGAGEDIVVGNDTSGLLAAVKLSGANSVLGLSSELGTPLGQLAGFSALQSGTFSINGVELVVDVLQDSLSDLIGRINAADTGAVASFDPASGKVRLRGVGSGSLELSNGTSDLFAVLDIAAGTHRGERGGSKTRFEDADGFRAALKKFVQAYAKLFEGEFEGFGAASIANVRRNLDGAVSRAFEKALGLGGSGTLRTDYGLTYAKRGNAERTLELDVAKLGQALSKDAAPLASLFFARKDESGFDGIMAGVGERLDQAVKSLRSMLGSDADGLRLDVVA